MHQSTTQSKDCLGWVWRSALAVFVLAAGTGALYRLGLTYGWTAGLELINIRHAHSHLMFFGWVTPVLFALIALQIRGTSRLGQVRTEAKRRIMSDRGWAQMSWILAGCFVAALVSYPLFLLFGYTPVAVGSARMPIAVIGSTLNMVPWWLFVVWYIRSTRGAIRSHAHLLIDVALIFLVLATAGAIGLAFLKPLGLESMIWTSVLTHVFVDYFSEGWFVLAVLGLAHFALGGGVRSSDPGRDGPEGRWTLYLLIFGLPFTFALGMPSHLVPVGLKIIASLGGIMVSVGLLANIMLLWPAAGAGSRWIWSLPLALLALKSLGQFAGSVLPGVWWADVHGMRILYLHLMLLGFVTLGLLAAAGQVWGRRAVRGRAWMYAAVSVVLASLVPLSPIWPTSMGGRWTYVLAAWLSFGPIMSAMYMLISGLQKVDEPRRRLPVIEHHEVLAPQEVRPTRHATSETYE